ncbi:LuxR C-terminal-related transcriptional regulator [Streptomyces sp. NPDC093149]|uniref:LuxR C-terminal-related transcriptional regulator n=1 Tax=Streptomyces sp. NPDC093149 TaxID=3366031 RepID=UPI0037F747DA
MCNFRQPPRPRSPRLANGRGRSSRSPSHDRARGADPSITPGCSSPTANTCAACARRAKRKRQLRSVLTTFRDLGALPGASRAEVELRAADAPRLTPQELEIVRVAADGLTNKQIGQRLYLSTRIIGNHLYHALPKLGITSRSTSATPSTLRSRPTLRTTRRALCASASATPPPRKATTRPAAARDRRGRHPCPSRPTKRWPNASSTSTTPTCTP